MKSLFPIFETLPRQTLRDLLSVLHDPSFNVADLPKSHDAYLKVKTHALRVPLAKEFKFIVEIDGVVRFRSIYKI